MKLILLTLFVAWNLFALIEILGPWFDGGKIFPFVRGLFFYGPDGFPRDEGPPLDEGPEPKP